MAVQDLNGAVVAITGGGRGIGLATAKALAARGARIAIGDIDAALAQQAAAGLGGKAGRHYGGPLDVRERAAFTAFIDAARAALGPVDVLVNNAGIMPMGAFLDETDALSDTQIDINLRGVVYGCKIALPDMLARGNGHIVNVASMAGKVAMPGLAVYCATKFAVVALTEALREEFRDSGVDFSAVLPSKVTTELSSGTEFAQGVIPTVSPEDVATAVIAALEERLPEIAVPRYATAVTAMQEILPYGLRRGLRRRLNDHRILESTDTGARAAYDARLAGLAASSGARKRKS